MRAETYINGYDAYSQWGVILAEGSLSALMTPPPLKQYITNESAAQHGRIVVNSTSVPPKVDARDVQLTIFLHAKTQSDFYAKYESFVETLQGGVIHIKTKYQPNVVYKLLYESCSQFAQFNGRLAKFVLRLSEPNPMDRDADD